MARIQDIERSCGRLVILLGLILIGCADLPVESTSGEVGLDWRRLQGIPNQTVTQIAASDSVFVLKSFYGRVYTSADGVSWDTTVVTDDFALYSISRAGGRFFVVGSGTWDKMPLLMASSNGVDWVRITGGLPEFWDEIGGPPMWVVYGDTSYFAVNRRGAIMASVDSKRWTLRQEPLVDWYLDDVTAGKGLVVAVGVGGRDSSPLAAISDGLNGWQRTPMSTTSVSQPEAVTFDGDRFIACGRRSLQNIARGVIMTSADGLVYSDLEPGINRYLLDIAVHPSRLIAVGNDGTIVTSPDGDVWTFRATGSYQDLRSIAVTRDRAMVIGTSGTLLVSP